ncbi:CHAT domain-containing tetratricopeptide repeat protein [Agromyces sp. NPDC004153]
MQREDDGEEQLSAFYAALQGVDRKLELWSQHRAPSDYSVSDELRTLHVGTMLDLLARSYPHREDAVLLLSAMLDFGDEGARGVLVAVAEDLLLALRHGEPACDELWGSGDRALSGRLTRTVADIAVALGQLSHAFSLYNTAAERMRLAGETFESLAQVLTQALNVGEQLSPPPRSDLARVYDNRGVTLLELGMPDEAIDDLYEAQSFADEPMARSYVNMDLASALQQVGELDLAVQLLEDNVRAAESGEPSAPRWLLLHNLAEAYQQSGDDARAFNAYRRAEQWFGDAPPDRAYIGARSRAIAAAAVGEHEAAERALAQAFGFAAEDIESRIQPQRFLDATTEALSRAVPVDSRTAEDLRLGFSLRRARRLKEAVPALQRAVAGAAENGDRLTELLGVAVMAATRAELGEIGAREAYAAAANVRADAIGAGLIPPAAMASDALAGMLEAGLDASIADRDSMILSLEAIRLGELNDVVRSQIGDHHAERLGIIDAGSSMARLANLVRKLSPAMAVDFYQQARAGAQNLGNTNNYAILSGELLTLLIETEPGVVPDVDPVLAAQLETELRAALDYPGLSHHARLSCHFALAIEATAVDPSAGLPDLRAAAESVEAIRREYDLGSRHAEASAVDEGFGVYPAMLAALASSTNPASESFDILQRTRARALLSALATRQGTAYSPPDLAESAALVAGLPTPTTFVDLAIVPRGLRAYILDDQGLRLVDVPGDLGPLRSVQFGDVRRRAREIVHLTNSSEILSDLVAAVEAAVAPGQSLLMACDDELANLPLHAIPSGGRPWGAFRSIGRIAAVGMLRYPPPHKWSSRSIVAGDSTGDLPYAADECREVAAALATQPMIGPGCTVHAVQQRLIAGDHDVVHLAVHGRADVLRGGRASLLFAADGMSPEWVNFDRLVDLPWSGLLIVFSGCSTAVGGPRNGRGLYGIAQAAAATGSIVTVASLWPVEDEAAMVFMAGFYQEFNAARAHASWVDIRAVMDRARAHLRTWLDERRGSHSGRARDGRDLGFDNRAAAHPPIEPDTQDMLSWASFVVIGNPILSVST